MKKFLVMARGGISINNIIERHPDYITISDSYAFRMGVLVYSMVGRGASKSPMN